MRTMNELETPGKVLVRLACPECAVVSAVEMEVMAQLTTVRDMDGQQVAELRPKVKAQKVAHRCRQTTLDGALE
jgi:hypothetical protein